MDVSSSRYDLSQHSHATKAIRNIFTAPPFEIRMLNYNNRMNYERGWHDILTFQEENADEMDGHEAQTRRDVIKMHLE
ncbi:hypothetical protein TcasGA2_TC011375 [Tribolium castaneum]|uniref:Uncharacterized protein n=1 Tax=Tribolium castaneum TaxID=7070 RepID=D6X4B0_TRICA|nr:hypothetical protein TcasGA2_TC011375 [Tribolium castaneum]